MFIRTREKLLAEITCRHCGEHNSLVATDISYRALIACSHCGQTIGVWGALAEVEPKEREQMNEDMRSS